MAESEIRLVRQVATTHDAWIRERTNADRIGLPECRYCQIMQYPETAIDEIRLVGLQAGLVRIREHRWYLSVQFAVQSDQVTRILESVCRALVAVGVHPDTRLVIDNLLTNDSVAVSLGRLGAELERGQSVPP